MTHTIKRVRLMSSSPGTIREIKVHTIGAPGAGPRVYVQAALHANEIPGLLIAHHLLAMVLEADRKGRVRGEIVIVPYANPIGLSDNVLGNQVGREALDGSGNYNRGWPDLGSTVVPLLVGKLGADEVANRKTIRAGLHTVLDGVAVSNELVSLQIALLREAVDADYVVDIHTELVALAGMVVAPWSLPAMDALIAELAPGVTHVTETPLLFDFATSKPWHDLAQAYPGAAVPQGCVSATVELRGVTDVNDDLARRDAEAMVHFLCHVGAIEGGERAIPPIAGKKTPHEAVIMHRTPVGGVIAYHQPLGTMVRKGDHIADVIDPAADNPTHARTAITAPREGIVYAYILNHLVRPNDIVVKIAGPEVWTPAA
jgi:predicted deacylase